MSRRVLILTASFGEGHNAAARAIGAAVDEALGPGTAAIVDLFAETSPRLNAVIRRAYLSAINRTPRLWGALYNYIDRSPGLQRWAVNRPREAEKLAEIIGREKPIAVCSTYPVFACQLAELTARGVLTASYFTVVTDSISVNSLWWRAPSAAWFVPNDATADVMRQAGVDSRRLRVAGFPVASFFADRADQLAPPALETGAAPRVLYIANQGSRQAMPIAKRLLEVPDWELVFAFGRDEARRREFAALASRRKAPTVVLGWTNQIPSLLMTNHAVVSKAGGATTQEAIAARCPMIVSQVVPGQEEGNYELLRRAGIGARAETPEKIVEELSRGFRDGGRAWREWRLALAGLTRPNAAREIVADILSYSVSEGAGGRRPYRLIA